MLLLLVPLALVLIIGLLALTTTLEQKRSRALVRFTMRSSAGPETTENVIAEELAAVLAAKGLGRPSSS